MSYRPGILIVTGTVLTSLAICLATVGPDPAGPRAAQDLGFELGTFSLTERSGRTITDRDLANRVWIASFIFTRCPLSCPRITSIMRGVQGKLEGTSGQLVSISVDPDRDTPDVLTRYAQANGADRDRWWFLTGPKTDVYDLIRDRFKLGVEAAGADVPTGAEEISHSSRLALVGPGNKVIGVFDSNDPNAIKTIIAEARRRSNPAWISRLPVLNATLNTACAWLLAIGFVLIRNGRVRGHVVCMATGVILSTVFLTSYLIYHYHTGSVPFRGIGPIRLVYFTILLSHTVLAAVVVPFIVATVVFALRRNFGRHSRIAHLTLPIWLYVSVTGVIIYLMLYQLPVSPYPSS